VTTYLLSQGFDAPPLRISALDQAMSRAGCPDAADWQLQPGMPGVIYTRPGSGCDADGLPVSWIIQAPGVAHELVEVITDRSWAIRAWSQWDPLIIDVTTVYLMAVGLPLPADLAWQAGARIAGHFCAGGGEIPQSMVTAALLAAYAASCFDIPGEGADAISTGLTGRLRESGVTVYNDRPADASLLAVINPPAAPYRLRRAGQPAADAQPSGAYPTLPQAMAATGCPGFTAWQTQPGQPDRLYPLSPSRGSRHHGSSFVIEAAGVARQFARACPDPVAASRRWSPDDHTITDAVLAVICPDDDSRWRLCRGSTLRAAARIAAYHGTGDLTAPDLFQILVEAYSRVGVVLQPATADEIAACVTAHLETAGIAVTTEQVPAPSSHRRPSFPEALQDLIFWRLAAPIAVLTSRYLATLLGQRRYQDVLFCLAQRVGIICTKLAIIPGRARAWVSGITTRHQPGPKEPGPAGQPPAGCEGTTPHVSQPPASSRPQAGEP
jgi:hypothetical protein